tara:strand:+ start:2416 stop:4560 length:2145 start_codon:yes stop_codon:yes gene_type:complete
MKLHIVEDKVNTVGVVNEAVEYTIKNSAKMFMILSDKTYKDKPLAVVREYGANAKDASNGVPFEVHLPNDLEPYFSVKDYGTGMTHQQVTTLLTTFGASDKDDDNFMIGALGIGSKAGYAYTQQFTVESRYDGMLRQYIAVMKKGIPSLTMVSEQSTVEGNGLTVQIPVKPDDIKAFVKAARDVYSRFDPLPIVKGYPNFEFHQYEYTLKGKDWGLKESGNYRDELFAVMGDMQYPIDMNSLRIEDRWDDDKVDGLDWKFNHISGDLHFPLGVLDIAASREELSYDDETIAAIRDRFQTIRNELVSVAGKEVRRATSLYDATTRRANAIEASKFLLSDKIDGFLWRGNPVPERINVDQQMWTKNYSTKAWLIPAYRFRYKTLSMSNHNVWLPWGIDPTTKYLFIHQSDKQTRVPSRVLQYMKEELADDKTSVVLIHDETGKQVELLKSLGITKWIKMEDIADTPQAARAKGFNKTTKLARVLKFTDPAYLYNNKDRDWWVEAEVDIEQTSGVFVDLRRFQSGWVDSDKEFYTAQLQRDELRNYIRFAVRVGLIDDDTIVYGCPGSYKNHMDGHTNWQNLYTLMSESSTQYVDDNEKTLKSLNTFETLSDVNSRMRNVLSDTPDDVFADYKSEGNDIAKTWVLIYNATRLQHHGSRIDYSGDEGEADTIQQALHTKYPMLQSLNGFDSYGRLLPNDLQTVVDYVKMIDKKDSDNE